MPQFLTDSLAIVSRVQPNVAVNVDVLPHVRALLERWLLPAVLLVVLLVAAPVAVYLADRGQV